jgi:hypothetical protein
LGNACEDPGAAVVIGTPSDVTSCSTFSNSANIKSMKIEFKGNTDDCAKPSSTPTTTAAGTMEQRVCNFP